VEDQVDCTACASLPGRDYAAPGAGCRKVAKHLRLSREKFLAEYTDVSEEEGLILKRNEKGCVFLDGNLCSIYEARPSTCVGFPHLVRGAGSLIHRMWQMIDRACYCPIVYNSLERGDRIRPASGLALD
jgi:Fe-S-cluster containining protein